MQERSGPLYAFIPLPTVTLPALELSNIPWSIRQTEPLSALSFTHKKSQHSFYFCGGKKKEKKKRKHQSFTTILQNAIKIAANCYVLLLPILFLDIYSNARNFCQPWFHIFTCCFSSSWEEQNFSTKMLLTVSNKEKLEVVIKKGLYLSSNSQGGDILLCQQHSTSHACMLDSVHSISSFLDNSLCIACRKDLTHYCFICF